MLGKLTQLQENEGFKEYLKWLDARIEDMIEQITMQFPDNKIKHTQSDLVKIRLLALKECRGWAEDNLNALQEQEEMSEDQDPYAKVAEDLVK